MLYKYLKLMSQKLPARMSCVFYDPDWNLLLLLLSAGKKISLVAVWIYLLILSIN
jgi:hypothetical protein